MPQIAQQDYIFIPILDGGEVNEDYLTQEIQNRLYQLAKDGRALDVVFVDGTVPFSGYVRPISFAFFSDTCLYCVYDFANGEVVSVNCRYREITNEPDAQEEH